MFDTNPTLIQPPALPLPANSRTSRTPLFLIHDGGGTTFDYFFLGDLRRTTYGIHNPNFSTGVPWDGGIPQLASLYIVFIRSLLFQDDASSPQYTSQQQHKQAPTEIILGGWSLGGLLSLEIAHQLSLRPQDETRLKVKGIVMIDSIYPGERRMSNMRKLLPSMPVFRESTAEETKVNVRRCLGFAAEMVDRWEMPKWGGGEGKEEEVRNDTAEPRSDGEVARSTSAMPPQVVLLRATDPMPVPAGEEGAVSKIDVHRGSKFLGWEKYGAGEGEGGYGLIKAVADVPGHHFNMFQEQAHAEVVTEKVKWACDLIDRG